MQTDKTEHRNGPLQDWSEAARQRHAQRSSAIVELMRADPARIRLFATAFLTANQEDMEEIRKFLCLGDTLQLARRAHRIKGAARITGDTALCALCVELEQACSRPKPSPQALSDCVARLESALRELSQSCQLLVNAASA